MRQLWCLLLVGLIAASLAGCSKPDAAPAAAAETGTIVSLSPAATDLLVAMGLGDRIVGVSPFEANEGLRGRLPKVGDYERIDWERLGAIKPSYLVVQGKRDRLPPGVNESAARLHITPVILQIDRLVDIRAAVKQLGRETNNAAAADKLYAQLIQRESTLSSQATTRPAVPVLIALGENGVHFVGPDTYLDDALALAGGSNEIKTKGYISLDAEKIASLRPRVVFLLVPAADKTMVARATAALHRVGLTPEATVVPLVDKDVLMPGTAAYTLAESMASTLRALP